MRSKTPTLHCDGDDGMCCNWDADYYEQCASTVGGVRITRTVRAPGWYTPADDSEDLCPEHNPRSATEIKAEAELVEASTEAIKARVRWAFEVHDGS